MRGSKTINGYCSYTRCWCCSSSAGKGKTQNMLYGTNILLCNYIYGWCLLAHKMPARSAYKEGIFWSVCACIITVCYLLFFPFELVVSALFCSCWTITNCEHRILALYRFLCIYTLGKQQQRRLNCLSILRWFHIRRDNCKGFNELVSFIYLAYVNKYWNWTKN